MRLGFKKYATSIVGAILSAAVVLPSSALSQISSPMVYSKHWLPASNVIDYQVWSSWRCADPNTMLERHVVRVHKHSIDFQTLKELRSRGIEITFRAKGQEENNTPDPYRHTLWLDQLFTVDENGSVAPIPSGRVLEIERPYIPVAMVQQRNLTKRPSADGSGYEVVYGKWDIAIGDILEFDLGCLNHSMVSKLP